MSNNVLFNPPCEHPFLADLEGKNSESLSVNLVDSRSGQSLALNDGLIEGEIKDIHEIDLEVFVESSECGSQFAYFFIEIEDGPPVSF